MIDEYLNSVRSRRVVVALLFALFSLLYLVVLGERPLFIPDEPRYGEIAREMLVSGDWIVPRLNGLLYFEKPPLGHWMNAISLAMFGENPFAVRFSSAFATGMSAILVYIVARSFFNSKTAPYLAVFIFLTTLEVQVIGTFSVLDPMFAVVLNGGIFVMASAALADSRKQLPLLIVAGVLFGLAFLTKGFLAFALPALILVPWLLVRKDYQFLIRRAWIAVVLAVLTIAPWASAIHADQPDFWHYFFWVEHIQRFAADNAQHKEPFYYFVLFLPALAFPWIFLLPATIKGLRETNTFSRSKHNVLLLMLWAVVPLVFFSIASGKLATYILLCFVPFSILTAVGLLSLSRRPRREAHGLVLAALAMLSFFAALVVVVIEGEELRYAATEWLKQGALYASLLVGIAALMGATRVKNQLSRLIATGLSIVPFMFALPLAMPDSVIDGKAPEAFISEAYAQAGSDAVLVTNGSLVRAVSWTTKRTDVFVIENGGETTYGLNAPSGQGRFLERDGLKALFDGHASVLVICKGACNEETTALLPEDTISSSHADFYAHLVRQSQERVDERVGSQNP